MDIDDSPIANLKIGHPNICHPTGSVKSSKFITSEKIGNTASESGSMIFTGCLISGAFNVKYPIVLNSHLAVNVISKFVFICPFFCPDPCCTFCIVKSISVK